MALGAWPAASVSAGTPSVASILRQAQHDMLAAGCVHIGVQVRGARPGTVVADIGRSSGRETYRSGTAVVTIRVTPKAAYVGGNAAGLRQLVGLTAAQERRVGTRFMEMRAGTSQYTGFADNLTVVALAGMLPHSGGIKLHAAGAHHVMLSWTGTASSASATSSTELTLSIGARVLPEVETSRSGTERGSTRFSHWGRVVRVVAPPAGRTISYQAVARSSS